MDCTSTGASTSSAATTAASIPGSARTSIGAFASTATRPAGRSFSTAASRWKWSTARQAIAAAAQRGAKPPSRNSAGTQSCGSSSKMRLCLNDIAAKQEAIVPGDMLKVSEDFWNIRGSYKIGGVIDVGTQVSLVRRANGRFVFLDSYTLTGRVSREVDELTGRRRERRSHSEPASLPHAARAEDAKAVSPGAPVWHCAPPGPFPGIAMGGGAHGRRRFARTSMADDFDFSVPRGVDFISANEKVHFSSVLALHRASEPSTPMTH